MQTKITDNTVLSNGIIRNGTFFPKKNLPSGTLRIVLTTQCNYECKYCFAEGEENKKKRIQKLDDLKEILRVSKQFGITSIKLTGGEPLLYPHIEELLSYIRQIEIPYVDLTTNISLLSKETISLLNHYGVNSLTLSLNTLKEDKFKYLSNFHDFTLIQENLANVIKDFTGKIRINCIIFDEQYDKQDYDTILQLCQSNHLGLRFVEPTTVEGLPITYPKTQFLNHIQYLRKKADKIIESDCKSVEYLFFGDWYLTVMHSLCDNKICNACTDYMYIRVTSDMKLKPCLSRRDTEVTLDMHSEQGIINSFIEAISYMGVGLQNEA